MSERIKITSDGTAKNTSIVNAETGEAVGMAYAFEVRGSRLEGAPKATVFCYCPRTEIIADAQAITVHPSLIHRAATIAHACNSPDVYAAFRSLFGISVETLTSADGVKVVMPPYDSAPSSGPRTGTPIK